MKNVLLVIVAVGLLASPAMARQWTSRTGGFSVEAELVDVKGGNVILKKEDGSQLTVPLNKLSLGDVRYIADVLKAADASITGGKTESPAAEKPQSDTTAEPAIAAEVLQKLRYRWKKGQSYVYRVKITGERGYYSEYYSGDVTYKVKSIRDNEIVLDMTPKMTRGKKCQPVELIVVGGSPYGPTLLPDHPVYVRSATRRDQQVSITVDPRGHVDSIEGQWQLPYLIGDLSQLMIEPLSERNEA
ncbi:unnamed protein product, partial [marine sediment metagenome]